MSEIVLVSGRLSFPTLLTPKASAQGGPPRFGCDIIFTPDSPELAKFMGMVNKIALDKWKEHTTQVMTMINSDRKTRCYGNGNERVDKKSFQPYIGYGGNFYVSSLNVDQPQAIDRAGNPIDPVNTMAVQAEFKKMYGGCHVSVALNPWTQDNKHGRAIRCKLIAIQFLRDDTPFGEAPPDLAGLFGSAPTDTPDLSGMPSFLS